MALILSSIFKGTPRAQPYQKGSRRQTLQPGLNVQSCAWKRTDALATACRHKSAKLVGSFAYSVMPLTFGKYLLQTILLCTSTRWLVSTPCFTNILLRFSVSQELFSLALLASVPRGHARSDIISPHPVSFCQSPLVETYHVSERFQRQSPTRVQRFLINANTWR